MTTDYRELLESEINIVDGKLLTSQHGVATLTGTDRKTVNQYVSKHSVRVTPYQKTGKTPQGKGYSVRATGLEANDVLKVVKHFATSDRVSKQVRVHSANMLEAFAVRGYEAWVSDMLGVKLDHTGSNATINQLLTQFPNIQAFVTNKTMDKVPCRVWLADIMEEMESELSHHDHNPVPELYAFLNNRLPGMAAATHKAMLGYEPVSRIVKINGHDVKQYLYENDAPLRASFQHLMTEFFFSRATAAPR